MGFFTKAIAIGATIGLLRCFFKIPAYILAFHTFRTWQMAYAVVAESIVWDLFSSIVITGCVFGAIYIAGVWWRHLADGRR
jgi:hypothetical protein